MHERLLFDRLMQAYQGGSVAQTLLMPQAVQLSYREYGTFLEHQALLAAAGFDAEDFGQQTVKLHTVPMSLGQPEAPGAFQEALEDLASVGSMSDDKRVEKIMQAACKHAVKGGERLPDGTLLTLVRDVLDGNVTPTCPHGRPLMLQLTRTELEKRFQRIPD
jgi:DNA mismatch repair protein MutL